MSKFDENLFGRIAVFKNYLTAEELEDGLKAQRSENPPRLLGEILLERGLLTESQLNTILEIRKKKVRKLLRDPKDARETDKSFGEIAVAAGYIGWEDVESAILEQERLAGMNLHFRIGEILVSRAQMEPAQVAATLQRQKKRILLCPLCDNHYNVMGFDPKSTYCCPECSTELMEPCFLETVAVDGFIEDGRGADQETEQP